MYFIIFKKKKDNEYRLFTNTIFNQEKNAEEFGRKSMKRNEKYKVVEDLIKKIEIAKNDISLINSISPRPISSVSLFILIRDWSTTDCRDLISLSDLGFTCSDRFLLHALRRKNKNIK